MLIEQLPAVLQPYSGSIALLTRVGIILLGTWAATRMFRRLLQQHFRNVTKSMDISKTSYTLIRRLVNVGIWIIGIGLAVHTVPGLRQISLALFASAGFIGIVIGFAAQEAFSNIISGIFIAIFTPFRVGDRVETNQQYGTVEDITLRHTVIQKPSNERIILPNAKILNEQITNYTIVEEKSRYDIQIPISYSDEIDRAKDIIIDEADAHELTETGESEVITKNLGDSGVILELRLWSHDRANAWQAGQDLRESIKERFDDEGITIPFPQRSLSGSIALDDSGTGEEKE